MVENHAHFVHLAYLLIMHSFLRMIKISGMKLIPLLDLKAGTKISLRLRWVRFQPKVLAPCGSGCYTILHTSQ
jgi:hypothetical protein